MKFLVSATAALLCLAGCGAGSQGPDPDVPTAGSLASEVEAITCPEVAYASDFEEAVTEHVADPHRFLDLYLGADANSQEDAPEVDFYNVDILAVLAGAQPSGGYKVYISDIHQRGDDLEVVYQLVRPMLSECSVPDVMTYPYCFVTVPKVQGDVVFIEETIETCGFELRDE